MNSLDPILTVIRPQRKTGPDPAEVRERAAALFGTATERGAREGPPLSGPTAPSASEARPEPAEQSAPPARPEEAARPEQTERPDQAERAGPVRRLRTWLFVRCGLEFKTVIALAAVLAIAGGLALQHFIAGRPRTVAVPPPSVETSAPGASLFPPPHSLLTAAGTATTAAPKVTVDIAGKVAKPGLRRLPPGSRVADALAAAGGALPGTDTSTLNLARPLADGEQILVGVSPPPAAPDATAPSAALGAPAAPLSLNSATAAQLDALPGVGPILAQHILDFRTQHGTFTSIDQLRQVPGIGDRKFTTLKPLVHP
jgi:competence protein ComEA